MLSEIGSNFWEYRLGAINNSSKFFWNNAPFNAQYFKSGRNAIKALCLSIDTNSKNVFLPIYTCESVIQPFVDEGWNITFYRINRNLSIDVDYLNYLVLQRKPDLIYIHSYFGFDTIHDDVWLEKYKKDGIIIAEDITQSLFSENRSVYADYYLASFRKFFAIPDGGALVSCRAIKPLKANEYDAQLANVALDAFHLKEMYMKNNDPVLKERFRKRYQELFHLIENNDYLFEMSPISRAILDSFNIDGMIKKRQKNYIYLLHELQQIKKLKIIFCENILNYMPLYFPMYVDNRKEFQSFLASNNIYCPIIWPKPNQVCMLDDESKYIYDHIICIPIDQRYGLDEMRKIVNVISRYFGE